MTKDDRIKVRVELMDDGRMRALSVDNVVLAHGQRLSELRQNVERVVRERCGEDKRISLLIGRPC